MLRSCRICPVQFSYLAKHPALLQTLVLFGLSSAFGQVRVCSLLPYPPAVPRERPAPRPQIFIFYSIRTFDSLTLSTITTTRKFFTVRLLSLALLPCASLQTCGGPPPLPCGRLSCLSSYTGMSSSRSSGQPSASYLRALPLKLPTHSSRRGSTATLLPLPRRPPELLRQRLQIRRLSDASTGARGYRRC